MCVFVCVCNTSHFILFTLQAVGDKYFVSGIPVFVLIKSSKEVGKGLPRVLLPSDPVMCVCVHGGGRGVPGYLTFPFNRMLLFCFLKNFWHTFLPPPPLGVSQWPVNFTQL